ncbi:MAG TPA: glutaredoxin family protein [Thermoleophilaceae bacterium]|jgi:glutaredoxin
MTQLTLYGKPGCCLCDEARAEIDAVRAGRDLELTEVDVSSDPRLWARYGERIPVVEIEGEEAFELHVDGSELAQRLDRVRA